MNYIPYESIVLIFIGITMFLFNRTIGVYSCMIGKYLWKKHHKNHPSSFITPTEVKDVYKPENASMTFKIMGVVLIFGGIMNFFYFDTGIVCIAPVPRPTLGEKSLSNPTGGERTFDFEVQIDELEPIKPDNTDAITLKGLSLGDKHLIKIRRNGKMFESFWFDFAERGGSNLCLFFKPLYETWHLWPADKCGQWSKCKP